MVVNLCRYKEMWLIVAEVQKFRVQRFKVLAKSESCEHISS
jgi:hypothetical protein